MIFCFLFPEFFCKTFYTAVTRCFVDHAIVFRKLSTFIGITRTSSVNFSIFGTLINRNAGLFIVTTKMIVYATCIRPG
jgi:hypothetical protein